MKRFLTSRRQLMLGLVFAGCFSAPAQASLNPAEKLFKKFLNFVMEAILRYYAPVWYDETKEAIDSWTESRSDATKDAGEQYRYACSAFGDALNQVAVEQESYLLRLSTAPGPGGCDQQALADANEQAAQVERIEQSSGASGPLDAGRVKRGSRTRLRDDALTDRDNASPIAGDDDALDEYIASLSAEAFLAPAGYRTSAEKDAAAALISQALGWRYSSAWNARGDADWSTAQPTRRALQTKLVKSQLDDLARRSLEVLWSRRVAHSSIRLGNLENPSITELARELSYERSGSLSRSGLLVLELARYRTPEYTQSITVDAASLSLPALMSEVVQLQALQQKIRSDLQRIRELRQHVIAGLVVANSHG